MVQQQRGLLKIKEKWGTGMGVIRDMRLVQKIDLEKTYVNSLTHLEVSRLHEIIESQPDKYPQYFLRESDDVKFLNDFHDKQNVTDEEIRQSECYQSSYQYMLTFGTFNSMNDEAALLQYCRSFLHFYRYFDKKPFIQNQWRHISIFSRTLGGDPPVVVKILSSDYYMILGGHHRLACLYVLGERFVNARVEDVIINRIEETAALTQK